MCDHHHRSTFRCLQGSTKNRFGTLAFLRTVVCRYQAHTDRNNNRIALCSSFKSVHIKIAVYSHSTIITVVIIYSATAVQAQKPERKSPAVPANIFVKCSNSCRATKVINLICGDCMEKMVVAGIRLIRTGIIIVLHCVAPLKV